MNYTNVKFNLNSLGFDENKCIEICEFIINNKDYSYDEIMSKLLSFNVNNRGVLNGIIKYISNINEELGKKTKVIIDLRYNEKNGNYNEEILNLYNELFISNNTQISDDYFKCPKVDDFNITMSERDKKKNIDDKVNYISAIANEIISGEKEEDVLMKYNITESHFKKIRSLYLPKNPETYVEYKIYTNNIKTIDNNINEFYKEKVMVLLEYLYQLKDKNFYYNVFGEYPNKNSISILNGLINKYEKLLSSLEEFVIFNDLYPNLIEDNNIREYYINFRNSLLLLNKLKLNNISDNTQKKIYDLYKKKVNIK